MNFRHFNFQLTFRVILISLSIFLFSFLLDRTDLYATLIILGFFVVYQIYALIKLMDITNQRLTQFLEAIRYADFSQTFKAKNLGKSFDQLNRAFAEVMKDFQRIRAEKEENVRYLQTVMQHIGIALLVYDQNGKIELINNAAKKLFNIRQIAHVQTLKSFNPELVHHLMTMKPRTRHLLKAQIEEDLLQLVIFTTEFSLRGKNLTLASIQNIQSELEDQEMEAWQKLIRVLTHEIMNSITPVSSLAKTVDELLLQQSERHRILDEDQDFKEIREAVHTIQKRSKGLLNFVESYRKLTRVPRPNLQETDLASTIKRVLKLMDREFQDHRIRVHHQSENGSMTILGDAAQIEQVLINLLKNAIEALTKKRERDIWINNLLDERGRKVIEIIDNGSGIAPEAREHLFVPFYSTKKEGSGIGLSLCRQIMRQHLGSIHVFSEPNEKTTFKLIFP